MIPIPSMSMKTVMRMKIIAALRRCPEDLTTGSAPRAGGREGWFATSGTRTRGDSGSTPQQDTQLLLFFDPRRSSRAMVDGNGWTRCTGPLAMSAVVWPLRLSTVTSAPCSTR